VAVWSGCTVEILDEGGRALFRDGDCDVQLEGGELLVCYWDEAGAVVFAGRADASGGYELWCRSRPRRAALRASPGGAGFEGSWREGDARGTWRIHLPGGG